MLADDGSLTGTDGCNRLVGTWTAEADTVTFADVASTRMACDGVDTWLSALATGTIAGRHAHRLRRVGRGDRHAAP